MEELHGHDTVEMPGVNGRPRSWSFSNDVEQTSRVELQPRVSVNDALTMHRMVVQGAGIACLAEYLCASDIEAGRLVQILPQWHPSSVDVNVVFPSNRELSPMVRAFVDFLKNSVIPERLWLRGPGLVDPPRRATDLESTKALLAP